MSGCGCGPDDGPRGVDARDRGDADDPGTGLVDDGAADCRSDGGRRADDARGAADPPPRDPDAPAWPPLVRAAGCDREALLRRIVGG